MRVGYLLDTHIWFWYLLGSERLPAGLKRHIDDRLDECYLSPISVWELSMLVERGRIQVEGDLESWFDRAFKRFPLREASLNRQVALSAARMDLPHRDPADRFLAATAEIYQLTLLTVDSRLAATRTVHTVSK